VQAAAVRLGRGRPMTKTLDAVIEYIACHIDQHAVCTACLDNSRCNICGLAGLKKNSRKDCQIPQNKPVRAILIFSYPLKKAAKQIIHPKSLNKPHPPDILML
jgi:hypothetical protein